MSNNLQQQGVPPGKGETQVHIEVQPGATLNYYEAGGAQSQQPGMIPYQGQNTEQQLLNVVTQLAPIIALLRGSVQPIESQFYDTPSSRRGYLPPRQGVTPGMAVGATLMVIILGVLSYFLLTTGGGPGSASRASLIPDLFPPREEEVVPAGCVQMTASEEGLPEWVALANGKLVAGRMPEWGTCYIKSEGFDEQMLREVDAKDGSGNTTRIILAEVTARIICSSKMPESPDACIARVITDIGQSEGKSTITLQNPMPAQSSASPTTAPPLSTATPGPP